MTATLQLDWYVLGLGIKSQAMQITFTYSIIKFRYVQETRGDSTYLRIVKDDGGMRLVINGMDEQRWASVWRVTDSWGVTGRDDDDDEFIECVRAKMKSQEENKSLSVSAYCLKKWSWGVLQRRKVRKWSWCGCSLLGTGYRIRQQAGKQGF